MAQLTNTHAFTITGDPIYGYPVPELRAEGSPMSREQIGVARAVYGRFVGDFRVSLLPFQAQTGTLPDGSPYRIVAMRGHRIMQVWPVTGVTGGTAEIAPGVRFNLVHHDDGEWAFDVVSPPNAVDSRWTRRHIDARGVDVVDPLGGRPINGVQTYSQFVCSFKAPPPAGYFYRDQYFGQVLQLGGLVAIPTGSYNGSGIIFTDDVTLAIYGTFGTNSDAFVLLRPTLGNSISLDGTGVEMKKASDKWERMTLAPITFAPVDAYGDTYQILDGYKLAAALETTYSFEGGLRHVSVGLYKELSSEYDEPFSGYRWFKPTHQQSDSWFELVAVLNGLFGYGYRTGSSFYGYGPLHDVDMRELGLLTDAKDNTVIRAEYTPSSIENNVTMPFEGQWTSPIGVGKWGVYRTSTIGYPMRCTASTPVPTFTSEKTLRPGTGEYDWHTVHTKSGNVNFHGYSEMAWNKAFSPAFLGETLITPTCKYKTTFDLSLNGSASYESSWTSLTSNPDIPPMNNLYAPVEAGGDGVRQLSFAGVQTLTHTEGGECDYGPLGKLKVRAHSLVEVLNTVSSRRDGTSGQNYQTRTDSYTQTWHYEERVAYVFDPEMNLLCYVETVYDGSTSYTRDANGYSAYPAPAESNMPDIVVVLRHGSNEIRHAVRPSFEDEARRSAAMMAYHPSAGLPVGFGGGDIPAAVSTAAEMSPDKEPFSGKVTVTDHGLGPAITSYPMNRIPIYLTTDEKTGAQPSGDFVISYSGRGMFGGSMMSYVDIKYVRSPDGLGSIVYVGQVEGASSTPPKAFLITANRISEMPGDMSSGIDFDTMQPF